MRLIHQKSIWTLDCVRPWRFGTVQDFSVLQKPENNMTVYFKKWFYEWAWTNILYIFIQYFCKMWKFSYGLNVTIHGIFIVFQSEKSSKWSQFLYFCQAFLPLMSPIRSVSARELTQIARKSRKLRVILPDLIQKRYAYFQRSRFSNAMRRWLHYQSCRLHRRLCCWCYWLYPEKVFKHDPICW